MTEITPTNYEIATCWELWDKYVDSMISKTAFMEMTIQERLDFMATCGQIEDDESEEA